MDENVIKISCTGATTVDYKTLVEMQGKLKTRTREQIDKLKRLIISDGFSYPFFIWKNNDVNYIIDGHGRVIALQELESEGYDIPLLPAAYIFAENEHEAKLKLLKAVSRYGDITETAFAYFSDGMSVEDLANIEVQFDKVEIVEIDGHKYLEDIKNILENPSADEQVEENASLAEGVQVKIICPCCMEECVYSISEIKKAIKNGKM